MVNAFDQVRTTSPALDRRALVGKPFDPHIGAGADSEAPCRDVACPCGLTGSHAGLALTPVQGILTDPNFGTAPQTLQALADLQNGLQ